MENPIDNLITLVKSMIVAASALVAIIGAYMYLTSGGNPEKIGKAKEYFYSAAIGLFALAFAEVFLRIFGIQT